MHVNVTSHPLNPNATPVIVSDVGVGNIEVRGLVHAGSDLQEQFGLDLLGGGEGDEHVVAGCHNTFGSGEIVDRNILDEPACCIWTITNLQLNRFIDEIRDQSPSQSHLQECTVVLVSDQMYEVQCQYVASLGVQLLAA